MRVYAGAGFVGLLWGSVSILYWRCRDQVCRRDGAAHQPRPVSILYWRCTYSGLLLMSLVTSFFNSLLEMRDRKETTVFVATTNTFNSLLEMHPPYRGCCEEWEIEESFNSLLEMPLYLIFSNLVQSNGLSILYWRCRLMKKVEILIRNVFQFSIGDAVYAVAPQPRAEHGILSILY